jgi:hypothetical protein
MHCRSVATPFVLVLAGVIMITMLKYQGMNPVRLVRVMDVYRDIDSDAFPLPDGLQRISRRLHTPDVHINDSEAVVEEMYEQ